MNSLVRRVRRLAEDDIGSANVSQIWGVALLLFVMVLSPILVILAKNAISSIQVFAGSITLKLHIYYIAVSSCIFSGFTPDFLGIIYNNWTRKLINYVELLILEISDYN